VAERLRVREIDDDEGRRLVRIVRRGSGSVVTWRRAQMVLLSAQQMDVAAIARPPRRTAVPEIVFCVDEFGPLNLQPRPGRQWAAVSGKGKEPGRAPRPRMRAAYHRTEGVRHLFAACELGEDKLLGHVKPRKTRTRFLESCRYLRSLYPPEVRIAIVCDNYSPHLSTRKDSRAGTWAKASNVEIAYTPTNLSWLNASRRSSRRCATSRSTGPATPATRSRPA
jgi:hypothetical protein